jgi:sugar lactone lactonase YvrE
MLAGLATAAAASAAYLLLWSVPVSPVAWVAPKAPGYVGALAQNQRLAGLQTLSLQGEQGPEHIVVRDGWVYAAVASGAIVRMIPDGSSLETVVKTGGRPLGFDFDATGALVLADPMAGEHGGIWRVDIAAQGAPELLTDKVGGSPIRYADAVVVAKNGRIYFTDASQRFGAKAWGGSFEASVFDILEHSATGRLLEYDPATKTTRVLLNDLCFANGLALSADEQHVFVNETGAYRIWKVPVAASELSAAEPGGGLEVLLDNLPGYPDNLMRGQNGRIWAGLAKPRAAFIDDNAQRPWLRALALRLPKALWPVPPAYGHVFAFDEGGRIVADLQDPSGLYPETTGVTETDDRLYVQSLHAQALGYLEKAWAGLPAH